MTDPLRHGLAAGFRRLPRRWAAAAIVLLMAAGGIGSPVRAVQLTPAANAAFDRYVALTEARMERDRRRGAFIWMDGLPESAARATREELRKGTFIIRRETTLDESGRPVKIPNGMVHHWRGIVFIPRATLARAVELAQDYDRYQVRFSEVIRRSRLIARDGNQFKVALRFRLSRIFTGVVDTESDATYTQVGASAMSVVARSTRVAEIAAADTPAEREYAPGTDNGYMWRVNSYWRLQERDGGVYMESEGVSLSRDVPFAFAWLVQPILNGLSRDTLKLMLLATRRALG